MINLVMMMWKIVEIDLETGEDSLVLRFNDTYSVILGSACFDSYNQRYFVGGSDENNKNIVMQFNMATRQQEQLIYLPDDLDQMFWNSKTNTLLGLMDSNLIALDLSTHKWVVLARVPGIPGLFAGALDVLHQQFYTITTMFEQKIFTHVDLAQNPIRVESVNIWNDFINFFYVPAQK